MTPTEQLITTHVPKYTDEQWEFIFELKCYGYSTRELARWLGVSRNLIQWHFKRLGFTSSDRLPLSTYDEKLRKLGDTHARPKSY